MRYIIDLYCLRLPSHDILKLTWIVPKQRWFVWSGAIFHKQLQIARAAILLINSPYNINGDKNDGILYI